MENQYTPKPINGWKRVGASMLFGLAALVGSANIVGCEQPGGIDKPYVTNVQNYAEKNYGEKERRITREICDELKNKKTFNNSLEHFSKNKERILRDFEKYAEKFSWINPSETDKNDEAFLGMLDKVIEEMAVNSLGDIYNR